MSTHSFMLKQLETLNSDWGTAKGDMDCILTIVNEFLDKAQQEGQAALPDELRSDFNRLEQCVSRLTT